MKKFLVLLIAIFCVFSLAAEETSDNVIEETPSKKEIKFPGKIGLEFLQRVEYGANENKSLKNTMDCKDTIYSRTWLKAGVKFPVGKIYSIEPWVGNRFEIMANPITEDHTDDVNGIRLRNRAYIGLKNRFSIPDAIDINLNLELRFASDLSASATEWPIEIRLTPQLGLGGKYKSGLSWSIVQNFEFFFIPLNTTKIFDKVGFENNSKLAFEFFHFFAPKEIKGSIAVDYLHYLNVSGLTSGIITSYYNELFAGMKFDIFGISPFLGFFMWIPSFDFPSTPSPCAGIQTGIGFKKEWFSFNITYKGGWNPLASWEHKVKGYVKFKL